MSAKSLSKTWVQSVAMQVKGFLTTAKKRVQPANESCEFCAASGLTMLSRQLKIAKGQAGYPYRYKLVHGAHRFYCSLAAGFKCVPAIEGFDRGEGSRIGRRRIQSRDGYVPPDGVPGVPDSMDTNSALCLNQ